MTVVPILDDRALDHRSVDILIVGAGPTGLGAATRLMQLGHADWLMVDSSPAAGGLARTDTTPEGFLFDMGGHVVFSHYKFFDQLLDHAVGESDTCWTTLERVSYVWIKDRWVPYPFQNNLFCLPVDDQVLCIQGAIDAAVFSQTNPSKPKTFDEWILRTLGNGIADLFMRPYNFKVWGYLPSDMQCTWLGERVATVDVKRVIENVLRNRQDAGWGPNAVFRFPLHGGTGGIWKKVCEALPQERVAFNKQLVGIDFDMRVARFGDGSTCSYNSMICTAPLDKSLEWFGRKDLVARLKYSSTHVVGLGIRGRNPHDKKCWMYFPEDNCPFYRCTVFSLYSRYNCPAETTRLRTLLMADGSPVEEADARPGPFWSLMFEISESPVKPVNQSTVIEDTIQGAINTKLIDQSAEIVSIYHQRLERGYPTPSLERDDAVIEGLKLLKAKRVWSRGRFGAWKYEVGNQDHSVMQGLEAVDNILRGSEEFTITYCDLANGRRNEDIVFTKH